MARLVSAGLIITLSAMSGAAVAADRSATLRSASTATVPSADFHIVVDEEGRRPAQGARIIAGTEVMPNATLGFGFFGHKSAGALAPVTERELAMPKQRKAAVGLSLRF